MSRYLGAFQDSYPDADYTPNDIGPPENNGATWDDFEDGEVNRLLETDNDTPL